ncbi:MAG: hypothetical protein EKK29_20770 [Hyphomicrobiales bacterium]|nr:MAG: hypothetical protein EKK29_20770 [Hyphomicrobiales bacterium]
MRVQLLYRLLSGAGCLAVFSVILVSGAPARADFLDDLFGGDGAPQPAPVRMKPARRAVRNFSIRPLDEHRLQRAAKEPGDGGDAGHGPYVAGSRPQKAALCDTAGPVKLDSSSAYLRDETLRAGDSVVTDGAIVVFKGSRACPHSASDFVSVARADLPKAKRNALAALEQGMRSPQRGFVIEADQPKIARDTH